jgi:DNA mismatch repair protein MutS2
MQWPDLDLDPESGRALEFDALLAAVAVHAGTASGADLLRNLRPTADPALASRRLEIVNEVGGLLEEGDRLVPGSLPDPRQALADLAVLGRRVEPLALRDLAAVLDAAGSLGSRLARLAVETHPRLREIGASIPDVRTEAESVLRSVEADGTLNDGASAELRRIRRSIARVGDRLRRFLEKYLHAPGASAVIQDEFITQRNGRFVIPVRVDAPRSIHGIVHATSSSGATQFVEPIESVDLNNDLVRLGEAEVEERERILGVWAEMFRDRMDEVRQAVEAVARVDAFQARALFGRNLACVIPRLGDGSGLVLEDVRHPLLDLRLRDGGNRCVPIGLRLDPPDRILVISGPNAGGKTVALKIIGLTVLMAQSGIPVPARSASLPVYRQVRADIGDHQSIDADLSTFSAHVTAVARFLGEVEAPTLLLFDEIGTGTEPREGAALARAVLEALRRPAVTTVATTHHGELKAWAFTEEGAESAAMEFDQETLRPTYRILMGAAGISAGLEIAGRMGLDDSIVDRARELIGGETRQTEGFLERLRVLTADLESRQSDLEQRRARIEREADRLAKRGEHDREQFQREARRTLETVVREFRERGKRELTGIRERREREKARKEQARVESRLRADAASSLSRVAGSVEGPASDATGADVVDPAPGMRVLVRSLGREGEVVAVRGDKVEVRLGEVGFTVRTTDLGAVGGAKVHAGPHRSVARVERRGERSGSDGSGAGPNWELLLIGKTVDEALPVLDKFLDDAALSGYGEVRVVHGHGTGRLRKAVRRFLSGHPLVREHRPGRPAEGGDGATVARLD